MSAMFLPENIIYALFVPAASFGVRHVQAILLFGCLTVAYTLRVNLSVAIVSMTDKNGSNPNFKEYEWNTQTRSTILSSFFWGYVVMQVPAGMLGQRFGPKLFLMGAMAVCSVFNMLTPLAASWGGWGLVCACRIIQGLSQDDKMGTPARIFPKLVDVGGIPSFNNAVHRHVCDAIALFQAFVFPSTHNILPMWSTPEERGRFATWVYAGSQFGTILAMPICGALAQSAAGWPSVFYLFGGVGLLWCVVWFFLGADSPASHKWISQDEKLYIEASLAKITSSDKNSLLSALPYLMMWIMSFIMSWAADFMETRKTISLTVSRKLFNSIAHCLPQLISSGECSTAPCLPQLISSGECSTAPCLPQLISSGECSTAPCLPQLISSGECSTAPCLPQLISSGIYFLCNLFFVLFGSAVVQPWNEPETSEEKSSKQARSHHATKQLTDDT
uniref:Inorganic phosphate cotransporter n=1 Tax=Timema bartmani TaxID=61472 RepID=A0A7R9I709_9NEOP|nr:unnamed protein product [Timema bartmani]